MRQKKVVVAMSGGVDSSVAAAVLKEQGYEVIGITMNLYSLPRKYCKSENVKSCCGWGAAEDAHHVALSIGIPHYVMDLKEIFEDKVIADFCEEYAKGQTPNPCIRCNEQIKWDVLLKRAEKLEADYLATGHHARVMFDSRKDRYLLKKGQDSKKDQSYFLYTLTQEQLSRTLMPIGDFTKQEVREKAQEFGLSVAQRPESQEICFIPDNDYGRFLREKIPDAFHEGPILDTKNQILAQHKGILHFTIGQRRGMGISARHPLYVIDIKRSENAVIVGTHEELYKRKLQASQMNWISTEKIIEPLHVKAKIRYKHKEAEASLIPLDSNRVSLEFEKSQRAITPGQAVVFYEGEVVIGGGTIEKSV